MIIEKIINNNIISTTDDDGRELVVMGKGLGFGTKIGREADETKIEKIFRLENRNDVQRLQELLPRVSMEEAKTVDDIVEYAKKKITVRLNTNIYITLTDHINFALERQRQNIAFSNPLLWEIKRYYPAEFDVGMHAIQLLEKRFQLHLSEDEAGFIALHFVNSEYNTSIEDAARFPVEIHEILDLVQNTFHLEYDEDSLAYERLLTHVKFLLQRVYRKETIQEEDALIVETIKKQCPDEYACCQLISDFLCKTIGEGLPEAEMVYMTIHIRRILNTVKETTNV